jgi:hypothetical protein
MPTHEDMDFIDDEDEPDDPDDLYFNNFCSKCRADTNPGETYCRACREETRAVKRARHVID